VRDLNKCSIDVPSESNFVKRLHFKSRERGYLVNEKWEQQFTKTEKYRRDFSSERAPHINNPKYNQRWNGKNWSWSQMGA
jgi:hypothetical protein